MEISVRSVQCKLCALRHIISFYLNEMPVLQLLSNRVHTTALPTIIVQHRAIRINVHEHQLKREKERKIGGQSIMKMRKKKKKMEKEEVEVKRKNRKHIKHTPSATTIRRSKCLHTKMKTVNSKFSIIAFRCVIVGGDGEVAVAVAPAYSVDLSLARSLFGFGLFDGRQCVQQT